MLPSSFVSPLNNHEENVSFCLCQHRSGSPAGLEAAQRRGLEAAAGGDAALPRVSAGETTEDQSAAGGAPALSGSSPPAADSLR